MDETVVTIMQAKKTRALQDLLCEDELVDNTEDILLQVEQQETPEHLRALVENCSELFNALPSNKRYGVMYETIQQLHEAYLLNVDELWGLFQHANTCKECSVPFYCVCKRR